MNDINKELQAMHEGEQKDLAESLKEINELAELAFEAKQDESLAKAKAAELKGALCALMETAGVDKISANSCTVNGKMKANASVPKDTAKKLQIFRYLAEKDSLSEGAAANFITVLSAFPTLLNMLTINATTFNSWYTKEQEAHDEDFKLDYISSFEKYSIGFRKKAGK